MIYIHICWRKNPTEFTLQYRRVKMTNLHNKVKTISLLAIGAFCVILLQKISVLLSSPEPTNKVNAMILTAGDAKVFTHDGISLRPLTGFCALTPLYDCALMDAISGQMPVYVHHTKTSGVSGAIIQTGSHEPEIMKAIWAELQRFPDAGFVDIGTNIGPFSLTVAKQGRRVLAADAVIENIQLLCKSVEKNGLSENVTMVINPVSDRHTSVSLDKGASRTFEMAKVVDGSDELTTCGDSPTSHTVILDDMMSIVDFTTVILKIDVEGFEYHVINGGKIFLKQLMVPSIIMEWKHVKKTINAKDLVNIMKSFGYTAHGLNSDKADYLNNDDYMNWPANILWTLNW